MSVQRITLVVALVIYLGLWALALSAAPGLVEPLAVPLVLAVLVAAGVWLQRVLGLEPRRQQFRDRDEGSGEGGRRP